MSKEEILHKSLNALRLEIDGSIVEKHTKIVYDAMDEYAKQEAIAYSKFCDELKVNADKKFKNVPKFMTAEEQYQFYLQSKQSNK